MLAWQFPLLLILCVCSRLPSEVTCMLGMRVGGAGESVTLQENAHLLKWLALLEPSLGLSNTFLGQLY